MVIKILNLEKTIKDFGDVGKMDVWPVIRDGARMVQRDAKAMSPVDTGALRNSISIQSYKRQLTEVVYTDVEYAPYQEFGTRFMRGQPFMRPALAVNSNGIKVRMRNFIKSELAKAVT